VGTVFCVLRNCPVVGRKATTTMVGGGPFPQNSLEQKKEYYYCLLGLLIFTSFNRNHVEHLTPFLTAYENTFARSLNTFHQSWSKFLRVRFPI
jgi:hypothetical protein